MRSISNNYAIFHYPAQEMGEWIRLLNMASIFNLNSIYHFLPGFLLLKVCFLFRSLLYRVDGFLFNEQSIYVRSHLIDQLKSANGFGGSD